ncbi:DUF6907 domain-containing protein [Saccharothrix variisporea]|uniref:Uncharacterized protein n=1 Tax=Saccharothrix variisporea TaxID=543527 RepID=A0A495WZF9_9PSEU|nr:hypothetical protein [Saccharothrix variisporea]RKT67082.1 hypothetical protein DFJ66_0250 [Saccharothrix variisporea]
MTTTTGKAAAHTVCPPWCSGRHTSIDATSTLHERSLTAPSATFRVGLIALFESTSEGLYAELPSIVCEGRLEEFELSAGGARRLAARCRMLADQLEAAAALLSEIRRGAR